MDNYCVPKGKELKSFSKGKNLDFQLSIINYQLLIRFLMGLYFVKIIILNALCCQPSH